MIEFNGEISIIGKNYIFEKFNRKKILLMILLEAACLIITFFIKKLMPLVILLTLLFLYVAFSKSFSPEKKLLWYLPKRIKIHNNQIELQSEKKIERREIKDVKKIIDYGEFYYIFFYFKMQNPYFICQKNLIIKGSIEEFEKIFEGKIERKYI